MIKLKGDGESTAQRMMNKALGGGGGNSGPTVDARGGRGEIESAPSRPSKKSSRPSGPSSSIPKSNAAPVYMQSKSRVDEEYEDKGTGGAEEHKGGLKSTELGGDSDFSDDEVDDGEGGVLAAWRAQRLQELKKTTGRQNQFLAMGHGNYNEISQDEFLPSVTKSKYAVCHFYHVNFERCKIIDKHIELLAPKHLATRFLKLNAEKAPFFIQKLSIKMLPTVVLFKDGVAVDRVVGFEELGARDDFTTETLEKRIAKAGVIITQDKLDEDELADKRAKAPNSIRSSDHNSKQNADSSDDDDDD